MLGNRKLSLHADAVPPLGRGALVIEAGFTASMRFVPEELRVETPDGFAVENVYVDGRARLSGAVQAAAFAPIGPRVRLFDGVREAKTIAVVVRSLLPWRAPFRAVVIGDMPELPPRLETPGAFLRTRVVT